MEYQLTNPFLTIFYSAQCYCFFLEFVMTYRSGRSGDLIGYSTSLSSISRKKKEQSNFFCGIPIDEMFFLQYFSNLLFSFIIEFVVTYRSGRSEDLIDDSIGLFPFPQFLGEKNYHPNFLLWNANPRRISFLQNYS